MSYNIKIKKPNSSYTEISASITLGITGTSNSLDSATSGRNNDTAAMIRTMIAEKTTLSVTIDETSNALGAIISDIIMNKEFVAYFPNTRTGIWQEKHFYCAATPIEIKKLNSDGTWINKEFTTEWVEI